MCVTTEGPCVSGTAVDPKGKYLEGIVCDADGKREASALYAALLGFPKGSLKRKPDENAAQTLQWAPGRALPWTDPPASGERKWHPFPPLNPTPAPNRGEFAVYFSLPRDRWLRCPNLPLCLRLCDAGEGAGPACVLAFQRRVHSAK